MLQQQQKGKVKEERRKMAFSSIRFFPPVDLCPLSV
jgi:hypothetical protein